MANQINPVLREETLRLFDETEWISTPTVGSLLSLTPQAAYGRLRRLAYAGWLRSRARTVRTGRVVVSGYTRRSSYVMEWTLSQKARRRVRPSAVVPVVESPTPAVARPVEIEEVFHRQRRTLGQP